MPGLVRGLVWNANYHTERHRGGVLAPIATGCTVLTDNLTSAGGLAAGGPTTQPFGISSDPAYLGLQFFSQAVAIDLNTFALSASNGFVISVGQ